MKRYSIGMIIGCLISMLCSTLWAAGEQSPVMRLRELPVRKPEQQAIFDEILEQGPQMIPELIEFLKEPSRAKDAKQAQRDRLAKREIMNMLADWNAVEALDTLEEMVRNSQEEGMILSAAVTIGKIGGDQSFHILEQILSETPNSKNKQEFYRKRGIITALGFCGDPRAIPLLKKELLNPQNNDVIQVRAASALGKFGNTEGLEVALKGLQSKDVFSNVKVFSIGALGNIGTPKAIEALQKLTRPEEPGGYRSMAQAALIKIEANQLSGDEHIEYIYQKLLEHPRLSDWVLWGTARLKELNAPEAKAALQRLTHESVPRFLRGMALRKLKAME